ncbi:MAG: branched-chain amino acid ABC transporter permease [Deltaproteobacteria bacterium]|nr:branched-chain amino acid ABC transporter permease [Deltaproteobacteria bacterium]
MGLLDSRRNQYILGAALLATFIIIPSIANNYIVEVLTNTWFYVVLALGLNIVVGYAGLLDLGYAAFFAVGAYTTGILCTRYGFNFWLTIPCAVLLGIVVAVIIGFPTLRLRSDYLAIVTLGFGEITRIAVRNLEIAGRASGIVGINRPSIFGMELSQITHFYFVFLILALLAIFASYRLQFSRMGRAWQYVREDEDAAEAMGINRVWVKLNAYIVRSIFASVAGCFYAVKMTAISPESFSFNQSILVLLAVVLGGMGKIPGMIFGAFALVLFPEVFRGIGAMRMFVFGLALLILMIFRPQGIWPERRH